MKIILHQTQLVIGDFDSRFTAIENALKSKQKALHLFPELFLSGYPLQDLCLQRPFYQKYLDFMARLTDLCCSLPTNSELNILVGGLVYEFKESQTPAKIENAAFLLTPGKAPEHVYSKQLLPNYDIFDEKKYFKPGQKSAVFQLNDLNIGLLICEDMWPSESHNLDPSALLQDHLREQNLSLDLLVNLSASPYIVNKNQSRIRRGQYLAQAFNCPFAYVNQNCSEDEIIFDGGSFYVGEHKTEHAGHFTAESKEIEFQKFSKQNPTNYNTPNTHVWEDLFSAQLDYTGALPTIPMWGDEQLESIFQALKFGLQEYAKKSGFNKFLVATSGGIDSALVLAIVKLALEPTQRIQALYLPGPFSSDLSEECVIEQCKNLDVDLISLPISPMVDQGQKLFEDSAKFSLTGLAHENIQSRLRGTMLYALSNQTGAMVINTSNKSELAIGYSTQYGDSVGAISLLGDLFKVEVFQLSHYLNKRYPGSIPEKVINRPPSAELRENQKDEDSLPPYERLDPMLELILSYQHTLENIQSLGFYEEEVRKTFDLYKLSEYKRAQFCPILKLKAKSFGFGYRIPISKRY